MAGQKWSQRYITTPYTSLKSTDLLAVSRGAASGAGQWGYLSEIDTNTIIIGNNGDALNNGAFLTPVLTLAQANAIAAADLSHRWKIICQSTSLSEDLAILPNVDYFFNYCDFTFSNITFPQWSVVWATKNITTSINGLRWNPSANVSGGFTGTIPGFQGILQINDCVASPLLNSLSSPKKISITGFDSAASDAFNKNFKFEINNFNAVPYGQFAAKIYFEFLECIWVQERNCTLFAQIHSYSSGGNTAHTLTTKSCIFTNDIVANTSTASGGLGMYLQLDGDTYDISGTISSPKVVINSQHTADYDLIIKYSPGFINAPDTSGSTNIRWSYLPFSDIQSLTNNNSYSLKWICPDSTFTDSSVWLNLGVGSFGKPYPSGAGITTTGESNPFTYHLNGKVSESNDVPFNPYNTIVGCGTPWIQSAGTKIINPTPWGIFNNAYFRAQFVDASADAWNLDFSLAGGFAKTSEFYNYVFSTPANPGGNYTVTCVNTSELISFNSCIGGIYTSDYNANYTQKGGSLFWNGGVAPNLSLQGKNANGSIIAQINGAAFNNNTETVVLADSKADCDIWIENCSVKGSTFNFVGVSGGGAVNVRTNCLNPANVTNGPEVFITYTKYAQCMNVTGTPTNYTPSSPPSGWATGAQQHFEGIDNKFGTVDSSISSINSSISTINTSITSINGSITSINSSITTINAQLAAYSYSGSTSTFGNGDLTVTRANSGGTVAFNTSNTSNTASSDGRIVVSVAGSSAGDAYHTFSVSGVTSFSQGIDNSDSDKYKRTVGADLNSSVYEVVTTAGEITHPLQPAFSAYLASTVNDKTGTGTAYTLGTDALTEIFDQNSDFNTNGTFTASVTGLYSLSAGCRVSGCTIANSYTLTISTSNRNYQIMYNRAASSDLFGGNITISYADMDAGDTAIVTIQISGEAADTADIQGNSQLRTYFNGGLAA